MAIRYFVGAVLLLIAFSGLAQGRDLTLLALIEALKERGYAIIYSDGLVETQQKYRVEAVDIDTLEQAVRAQGLQLQQREEIWLIVPGSGVAEPEPAVEDAPLPFEPPVLETVIVTGTRYRFPRTDFTSSSHSYRPEDMTLVPSLASDAMRVALRLPGVSSLGVSAKPRIRGGLQDELLVMQDGVELLEPFHLADYHSAYSTIDYHTIESLDIYTGGFPSRYGNRMSGVMDISNNWEEADYNTDIGLSTFANFINSRGQFGTQRPADWSFSLREGDLSDLTDYIQTRSGKPEYLDIAGRLKIALSNKMSMDLGVVHAEDDILFEDEEESASSEINTDYAWVGFDWLPSKNLSSRLTLSWLDFQRVKLLGSFEVDEDDEGKGGLLDHKQDVQRWALRNDFSTIYAGQLVEFGWQAEYNKGEYRHKSLIDRGELADIIGTEREVARNIYLKPDGWSGGAYLQAEWELSDRLLIQPSLRWDYQDYYLEADSEYQISPRLGLAYELNEETRLRLSLGRFYQPESIQELQVLDGITQFYPPQHSDQAIAAVEWNRNKLSFVGELYYKKYGKQKGRFENMFNPFVLLPEMEPDRVGIFPSEALAQGVDLGLKYEFLPELRGNFSYSYMDADDRINGKWIPRRWSQQHTVNTGLIWQKESYSLSLAVTWHSGWRSSKLPRFVPEDTVIPLEISLNNVELDDYFSLDISARKYWDIGKIRLQIYADISNVTDRDNEAGIDYDVEEVDGGFELIPDHETLLKRVPSVGITLSF